MAINKIIQIPEGFDFIDDTSIPEGFELLEPSPVSGFSKAAGMIGDEFGGVINKAKRKVTDIVTPIIEPIQKLNEASMQSAAKIPGKIESVIGDIGAGFNDFYTKEPFTQEQWAKMQDVNAQVQKFNPDNSGVPAAPVKLTPDELPNKPKIENNIGMPKSPVEQDINALGAGISAMGAAEKVFLPSILASGIHWAATGKGALPSEMIGGPDIPRAVQEEQIKHPLASAVGQTSGELMSLAAMSMMLGPWGSMAAKAVPNIPLIGPTANKLIQIGVGQAATRIPAFTAQSALEEYGRQSQEGKIDYGKLGEAAGEGAKWGTALSVLGFIPGTVPRVLTAGAIGGGIPASEKIAKKGLNLDTQDLIDIGANAAVMMGFELIGAKRTSEIRKQALENALSDEIGIVANMRNGLTREQAKQALIAHETARLIMKERIMKIRQDNPNMTGKEYRAWVRLVKQVNGASLQDKDKSFYKNLEQVVTKQEQAKLTQAIDEIIAKQQASKMAKTAQKAAPAEAPKSPLPELSPAMQLPPGFELQTPAPAVPAGFEIVEPLNKETPVQGKEVKVEQGKQIWEMTPKELAEAAKRGKMNKATGIKVPGEENAKSPLKMGELNNYSYDDIAHFYVNRHGLEAGHHELIMDALDEGKIIPDNISKMYPTLGAEPLAPAYGPYKDMKNPLYIEDVNNQGDLDEMIKEYGNDKKLKSLGYDGVVAVKPDGTVFTDYSLVKKAKEKTKKAPKENEWEGARVISQTKVGNEMKYLIKKNTGAEVWTNEAGLKTFGITEYENVKPSDGPTPISVVKEKIVKPKAVKGDRVVLLPNKQQLISEIEAAIKIAPEAEEFYSDKERPEGVKHEKGVAIIPEGTKLPTVFFKIDGGANIINNKEALTKFLMMIEKTPASKPKGEPSAPGFTTPAKWSTETEALKELIPTEDKTLWTDGHVLVKGTAPKKAKFMQSEDKTPIKPLGKKATDQVMSKVKDSEPAEIAFYMVESTEYNFTGTSDEPIPYPGKAKYGDANMDQPFAIVKSKFGYEAVAQMKMNVLTNRFPNAEIRVAPGGEVFFMKGKELLGMVMPLKRQWTTFGESSVFTQEKPEPRDLQEPSNEEVSAEKAAAEDKATLEKTAGMTKGEIIKNKRTPSGQASTEKKQQYNIPIPKPVKDFLVSEYEGDNSVFAKSRYDIGIKGFIGNDAELDIIKGELSHTASPDGPFPDRISDAEVGTDEYKQLRKTYAALKSFRNKLEGKQRSPGGQASTSSSSVNKFEQREAKPSESKERFTLQSKFRELLDKYDTRLMDRKRYAVRGSIGTYYPRSENIAATSVNNFSTMVHEMTHHLDNRIGFVGQFIRGTSHASKLRRKITDIYEKYYGGADRKHPLKKRVTEGFATLIQEYVARPTAIRAEFPELVAAVIDKDGQFNNPIFNEFIDDLEKIITEYQGLTPEKRMGARITSQKSKVAVKSFLSFGDVLRTEVADNVYPLEKLSIIGGKHFTTKDPSLWARLWNNHKAVFMNNVQGDNGYWHYTKNGGFEKAHDYNWKTVMKEAEKLGTMEQRDIYLVARDQYFKYEEIKKLTKEIPKLEKAIPKLEQLASEGDEKAAEMVQEARQQLALAIERKNAMSSELIKNDFTENDVYDVYNAGKEKYAKVDEMRDTLVKEDVSFLHLPEVGLLNNQRYNELMNVQGYASLKREFMNDIIGEDPAYQRLAGGGIKTNISSLMRRTGSERTIISPSYNDIINHSEILNKGLKQAVINKVAQLAMDEPLIFKELMNRQQLKAIPDPETGVIHFPQDKDPNIIMARLKYKRVPFLVDSIIKRTIDEVLNIQDVGTAGQIVREFSKLFTKGTTQLYPQFAVANFTMDQITVAVNSRNGMVPVISSLKEIMAAMKGDHAEKKYFDEYMAAGGERQTFIGWQDKSPEEVMNLIMQEEKGLAKALDLVNKGVHVLGLPAQYSEILTRVTEYIRSRKAGNAPLVALEDAGRVSAPFHHIGRLNFGRKKPSTTGQTFVKSIPFFNPSIQVLDQTIRMAVDEKGRKRLAIVVAAITAAMLASGAIIWGSGSEKQKRIYNNLSADELARYLYFPNPIDNDTLIQIRIPQEYTGIGAIVNMAVRSSFEQTNYTVGDYIQAGTAWLPTQFNALEPTRMILSWFPQIIKPTLMTIANIKDYPDLVPIERESQKNLPIGLRSDESTSWFAKKAGEVFGTSPKRLDYWLTQTFGRASGILFGKPSALNPMNSIIRKDYPKSGRLIGKFYDIKEDIEPKLNAYKKGLAEYDRADLYRMKRQEAKVKRIDYILSRVSKMYEMDKEKYKDKIDNAMRKVDKLVEELLEMK